MKPSPNIGLSEVQNTIELRQKVKSFKHHIQNLEIVSSKRPRCTSAYHSANGSCARYPLLNNANSSHFTQTAQSSLFNKYEREKLNQITKDNVLLLSKLMKTDQAHSHYYDKAFDSKFNQFRNNFMVSKFHDRKRSLSQITKENNVNNYRPQRLNKKIQRQASSDKVSPCNEWKKGWDKNMKNYSKNLANKFPKIAYDYKVLAQKQLRKEPGTFNRLKLRL